MTPRLGIFFSSLDPFFIFSPRLLFLLRPSRKPLFDDSSSSFLSTSHFKNVDIYLCSHFSVRLAFTVNPSSNNSRFKTLSFCVTQNSIVSDTHNSPDMYVSTAGRLAVSSSSLRLPSLGSRLLFLQCPRVVAFRRRGCPTPALTQC